MMWNLLTPFLCVLYGMFRVTLVEPLVFLVGRSIDGCLILEGSCFGKVVGDVFSPLLTCFCNLFRNNGKCLLSYLFSLVFGVGILVIIVMFVDVLQPLLMLEAQPFVLGSEKSFTSFVAVTILGVFWVPFVLVPYLVFLFLPLFVVWTFLFGMTCIAYFYIDSRYRVPKGIEPFRYLKCMVPEWEWYRPWVNKCCGLVNVVRLISDLIFFHCCNLRVWKWRLLYLRYLAFPYIEWSRPWVQTSPTWLHTLRYVGEFVHFDICHFLVWKFLLWVHFLYWVFNTSRHGSQPSSVDLPHVGGGGHNAATESLLADESAIPQF